MSRSRLRLQRCRGCHRDLLLGRHQRQPLQLPRVRSGLARRPHRLHLPDAGEVLEMTAEVDDAISAGIHEIILGIDADSFSLIEDADGTVVTVTYWY